MDKKNKSIPQEIIVSVLIFIFLFFFVIAGSPSYLKRKIKLAKKDIAERYGIDKRLLTDWINCFAPKIERDLKRERRRKLILPELTFLYKELGSPYTFPVFWRSDICELIKADYKQLVKIIAYHQKRYDSAHPMLKLSKFPPNLSKTILEDHGVTKAEIKLFLKKNNKKIPIFFIY